MRNSQWTAHCCPEIIETKRWCRSAQQVREPIIRVQNVVAEIFEDRPGIAVGPGSGDKTDLSAWHAAKFRGKSRCSNPELLQRVRRNQITERAHQVVGRQLSASCLGGADGYLSVEDARPKVRAYAVYSEVIGYAALTVDAELTGVVGCHGDRFHTGSQFNQALDASSIQRHLIDEVAPDDGPDRGIFQIHQRCTALYRDDGARVSDTQREIEPGVVADLKPHPFPNDGFESIAANQNSICSRCQRGCAVIAALVCPGLTPPAGLLIAHADVGAGDIQTRRVANQARDLRLLADCRTGRNYQHQQQLHQSLFTVARIPD